MRNWGVVISVVYFEAGEKIMRARELGALLGCPVSPVLYSEQGDNLIE